MALPSCHLVYVGGRHSQSPGPSPTLGPLGPSHQQCHKSWVSLRGPLVPMVFWTLLMERCATLCAPRGDAKLQATHALFVTALGKYSYSLTHFPSVCGLCFIIHVILAIITTNCCHIRMMWLPFKYALLCIQFTWVFISCWSQHWNFYIVHVQEMMFNHHVPRFGV